MAKRNYTTPTHLLKPKSLVSGPIEKRWGGIYWEKIGDGRRKSWWRWRLQPPRHPQASRRKAQHSEFHGNDNGNIPQGLDVCPVSLSTQDPELSFQEEVLKFFAKVFIVIFAQPSLLILEDISSIPLSPISLQKSGPYPSPTALSETLIIIKLTISQCF